jgi:glycosyltransferase involved in cell wall biosynthesis
MAHATALIVSSYHEGFGFITVEAMFNGCLVIGNNKGGTNGWTKAVYGKVVKTI